MSQENRSDTNLMEIYRVDNHLSTLGVSVNSQCGS